MDTEEIARRCASLSLTDKDGPVAKIDANLQEAGRVKLSLSLVGKILANRDVNRDAFKSLIPLIWRTKKGVVVEKRVLEGGPWSFDKNLLILKEADGYSCMTDQGFRFVPFWIQIYNLHLLCLNKESALFLGNQIGKFLRVRILLDVSKPLKRGLRVNLSVNLENSTVLICYERLPNFCHYCGRLGHLL
ncbi:hypothetical protein ACOSQ2_003849 [Xanthoceras sorbifolium]